MGLLTDPNNKQRGALAQLIISHHTKLSWLSYCAGMLQFAFTSHLMGTEVGFFIVI
jgi:hypothetical protein